MTDPQVNRSTGQHIESRIFRDNVGQCVDLMGKMIGQQVDILRHEYKGNIVVNVATL